MNSRFNLIVFSIGMLAGVCVAQAEEFMTDRRQALAAVDAACPTAHSGVPAPAVEAGAPRVSAPAGDDARSAALMVDGTPERAPTQSAPPADSNAKFQLPSAAPATPHKPQPALRWQSLLPGMMK